MSKEFTKVNIETTSSVRARIREREENLAQYQEGIIRYRRQGNLEFAKFLEEISIPDLENELASLHAMLIRMGDKYRDGCRELADLE